MAPAQLSSGCPADEADPEQRNDDKGGGGYVENPKASKEEMIEKLMSRFRAAADRAVQMKGSHEGAYPKSHMNVEPSEPDWLAAAIAYDVVNRREVIVNRTAPAANRTNWSRGIRKNKTLVTPSSER